MNNVLENFYLLGMVCLAAFIAGGYAPDTFYVNESVLPAFLVASQRHIVWDTLALLGFLTFLTPNPLATGRIFSHLYCASVGLYTCWAFMH